MSELLEIQRWFASIITRPFEALGEALGALDLPVYDEETIKDISHRIPASATLRPEQRIGIYHQQYWWRLFVLLQEYYPTLLRLFGARDFNANIAQPYLLKYPPTDWFLPNLAKNLPQWIRESYTERDAEPIYQLARIDEAYERLFHAPSGPPLTSADQTIYLQPFVELFELRADFFAFRAQLLEQEPAYWETCDFPDLIKNQPNYFFALYRKPSGLHVLELSKAQYLLLHAFKAGSTLENACETLAQDLIQEASMGIADWMREWAAQDLFTKAASLSLEAFEAPL